MFQFKTVSALCALALCGFCADANAAGGYAQAPQSYFASSSAAAAQYANAYGPVGVGNVINTNSIGNQSVNNAMTVSTPNGNLNVQTNIDNTKTIESASSINVTNTINGYNTAYGLNGGQALNVIENANSYGADVSNAYTGAANDVESDALSIAGDMEQAQ